MIALSNLGKSYGARTLFEGVSMELSAGNRYGLPPFYELHAWLWQHNPSGFFEDWNPRVTCAYVGLSVALGRPLAADILHAHEHDNRTLHARH